MLTTEERIKRLLRGQTRRIKQPIRRATGRSYKTNELLGCSYAEARQWIETKFKRGMGWHNTGRWEIDHIIPIAAFDLENPTHILRVNHYSNLQPLWRKENRDKRDQLPTGQLLLL
jgi:5-methylcytosine-specific restriction endonuclease McrA